MRGVRAEPAAGGARLLEPKPAHEVVRRMDARDLAKTRCLDDSRRARLGRGPPPAETVPHHRAWCGRAVVEVSSGHLRLFRVFGRDRLRIGAGVILRLPVRLFVVPPSEQGVPKKAVPAAVWNVAAG